MRAARKEAAASFLRAVRRSWFKPHPPLLSVAVTESSTELIELALQRPIHGSAPFGRFYPPFTIARRRGVLRVAPLSHCGPAQHGSSASTKPKRGAPAGIAEGSVGASNLSLERTSPARLPGDTMLSAVGSPLNSVVRRRRANGFREEMHISSKIMTALCAIAFIVAALRLERTLTDVAVGFGVGCAVALGVTWLGERAPPE